MISSSIGYALIAKSMQAALERVASEQSVKRDAEYYKGHINEIKDVDGLLADQKLYSYAMDAYGLSDMTYAKAFMKKVLESDLTDPNSFANKLSDSRYKTFAAAFNFHSPAAQAQTAAQEDQLIGLYNQSFQDSGKSANAEAAYFKSAMRYVHNVNDLLNKPRLKDFVMDTFGIDGSHASRAFLKSVLTSDVNDPNSFVNTQSNAKYKEMASFFSFGPDGDTSGTPLPAQTATQRADLVSKATVNGKSYFLAKIQTIGNVDELLSDRKMNDFVRATYGVATTVSDSDLKAYLTDPKVAAEKGFKPLNVSFSFKPDGTVNGSAQTSTQSADTSARFDKATAYFSRRMETITGVDDLSTDSALATYIKLAFAVPRTMKTEDFSKMLTDPDYAASIGAPSAPSSFNFNKDGSLVGTAQTLEQKNGIVENYTLGSLHKVVDYDDAPGEPSDVYYVTSTAANYNKAHFEQTIKSISNIDQLMSDDRMVSYIKAAFSLGKHGYGAGIADGMSGYTVRQVLVNPKLAAQLGVSDLHDAFNFNADGSVSSAAGAQSDTQLEETSVRYMARYQDEAKSFIKDITTNYKKRVVADASKIQDIGDLLKTNRAADIDKKNDDLPDVYHVALQAFGLTEAEVPKSVVRKLLESDAYAAKGYVASFKDQRITNFARAFNFNKDGSVGQRLTALSAASVTKYASSFKTQATLFMTEGPTRDKASKDAVKSAEEFAKGMDKVTSLDDLLANAKLTGFILKSVGLEPKDYSKDTLKKIFTSDPSNPKSFLNTKADGKFKEIVADFNFDTKGKLTRAKLGAIQDQGALDRTQRAYVQQKMETQQGETNDGTRLALYFARKAPQITSLYSILGDKALFQVVATAFNLPAQMAGIPPEKQVKVLARFIDPKDLGDAKKVDKLLRRFTAMYDAKNTPTPSPALQILGKPAR
ncbi:DUF1217 domain-containing protein [Rhizobium sp. S152]|uniref:DUF1217 domain-containing protein n=1 Tax=Rhizobium sp. S152 TaxID=3055038 RepID=UPI0025A9E74D|nr:DUF1217 domain-containing protein [Rhizobium sp. S152]MDM9628509.1 DUF1217 domain-containing protein [Rhizobium sp. S152]